jgi:uncharacterized protein (TIGR00288 family)
VNHTPNIAVFCDFENVALGARDAHYGEFEVERVLERLLDKGQIVVKKAYSAWSRYEQAKRPMHEAAFELVEIPHVSYSGKNSADIRMVVDALDLCYTKPHVEVFALITGDSDFSPLVSKLRENGKTVIGVGVKASSSDLLVANCDEFIYYDDLVRRKQDKRNKRSRGNEKEALDLVLETVESLFRERDDKLWGSMVKQTIKRKRPHFTESYYGYRSFSQLLEHAAKAELLEIEKDARSGGYVITDFGSRAA